MGLALRKPDVRVVKSLGVSEEGKSAHPAYKSRRVAMESSSSQIVVRCEENHTMKARVTEELWHAFPREAICRHSVVCQECGDEILDSEAYYHCAACHYALCVDCSRGQLGLPKIDKRGPPLEIYPGDVFFCGPDKYGIHHVILSRGQLRQEFEMADSLGVRSGTELWSCPTIEATQGSCGEDTWWYPTRTFFSRDSTGAVHLVADSPDGEETIFLAEEPVCFKVLLHPFRRELGNVELDYGLFHQVIERAASESRKYGKHTAVKSWFANQKGPGIFARSPVLDPNQYPDDESRCELLNKIYKSWNAAPICASVAIKTWQMYFDALCGQADDVAQCILDWMPCMCHRTVPSAMLKTLSSRGWVLSSTLDAWNQEITNAALTGPWLVPVTNYG